MPAPTPLRAPEPPASEAPSGQTPDASEEIDWDHLYVVSEDVDLSFWSHLYLGIVPHFTATQLYDAPLPSGVDRIVAFNRGTSPDEFLAEGLSPDLAHVCFIMSMVTGGRDTLVFLTKDNRILSWLPIQFDSTVATGNVLVVKCD